jgi:hypothetical protein
MVAENNNERSPGESVLFEIDNAGSYDLNLSGQKKRFSVADKKSEE